MSTLIHILALAAIFALVAVIAWIAILSHFDGEYFDGDSEVHP